MNRPTPPEIRDGRFIDTASGLVIPRAYVASGAERTRIENPISLLRIEGGSINAQGYNKGRLLDRDPDNLVVRWPEKGSGLDDLVSQAIVDGAIANVGVAPVIAPQISAMVRRQQDQAATASVEVMGRATPTRKASDAISRFNDSPLGINDALKAIVHHMRTYNRGCPIATVPITYDLDHWEEYGLEAIPLEGNTERYWLNVNWEKHGQPIPFLPSPFDLEATGNPHWPYWYLARRGNKRHWVLLHSSQIMPLLPGRTSHYGLGTCSVWICLGFLAESILVLDERIEKKINALSEGILLLGGVDQSSEMIKETIENQREEAKNQGLLAAKGYTLITGSEQASFAQISFRQPDNRTFEEQRQYEEDVLAFAFQEPLNALVSRGGVGHGAMSEAASESASDTGVNSILDEIGSVLGAIYPRVQVSVSRPNNRAQRLNIEMFRTFSEAVSNLPEGTLEPSEIRGIIQRDIIDIPESDQDDILMSTNDGENETDLSDGGTTNTTEQATNSESELSKHRRAFDVVYEDDEIIITDEDIAISIEKARVGVSEQLAEMLQAVAVED